MLANGGSVKKNHSTLSALFVILGHTFGRNSGNFHKQEFAANATRASPRYRPAAGMMKQARMRHTAQAWR